MNKQLLLLMLLTNFTLMHCTQKTDENKKFKAPKISETKTTSNNDYSVIKFIDKFDNKLVRENTSEKTEAQFSPIYIGEKKDEVNLIYKTEKIGNRVEQLESHNRPDLKSIAITIDTSRTVGSPMGVWEYYKKPEYRNEKIAFPVFIENTSTDTLIIGIGDIFPIIIEAKDTAGNWRPIQRQFIYDCGTGLTKFYLNPKQIAITTMKIFKGNFKTKLRVVFDDSNYKIYSNEINGQINLGQFE